MRISKILMIMSVSLLFVSNKVYANEIDKIADNTSKKAKEKVIFTINNKSNAMGIEFEDKYKIEFNKRKGKVYIDYINETSPLVNSSGYYDIKKDKTHTDDNLGKDNIKLIVATYKLKDNNTIKKFTKFVSKTMLMSNDLNVAINKPNVKVKVGKENIKLDIDKIDMKKVKINNIKVKAKHNNKVIKSSEINYDMEVMDIKTKMNTKFELKIK